MTWRLAKSLETLREQVNEAHPNRSKASDGTLGDSAHAGTASDHNPNAARVVCALDLTHDPANGFDAEHFVQTQRRNPHPNLKYMVWRGQIYSRIRNWQPAKNTGHYQHVHISVGVGRDGQSKQPYDDTNKWDIGGGTTTAPLPPIKGYDVTKTKIFEATVKVGSDGKGYVDVYHNEGTDPVGSFAQANGGWSNGNYPGYTPLFWTAANAGAFVRVTVVNAQANGQFSFKLLMGW